ncbi:MAG: phosphoribosylglycinamide synthetase [Alphaproteobacteria bacterium]|nr:phosphoribosylglycinamide synthetase [Alphaproteobacteria bacterium]MBU1515036.1 phosphoribosylglycinamide synthetase [Alphaproteobacteria bacterium]MBU2095685.1 phosphoribosylglycinamide synthetase [Alphaproteobacteria bacterium]MBU2152820.1 phosphoribosylglycinamide synthetase [Alphaproteobacteria bacterium]MBU2306874.1 phosphoribosylglycinamide synthetase [Alphaproteobacteria bacterium]
MSRHAAPRTIPATLKRALRVLFIAKHARWEGGLHPGDGTHAVYHREMRQVLEGIGLNLMLADDYRVLFDEPLVDFVFPLLNRGGFLNSEMLLPLLCERLDLPYLGASPILRGLADDKHLAKRAAVARGVPTAPWAIFRQGAPIEAAACPAGERFVIKPNASSASWGVSDAHNWAGVRQAVIRLHDEGHDAIVEPFIAGHDIEVSVITVDDEPLILPTQIVEQADPGLLRTYQEKRNLCAGQAYEIRPLTDPQVLAVVEARAREMMREFMPFDYGRFEFRIDVATGAIQFLEVNLNCNLWSRKTIAMAAAQIGWSHGELIETILAESLSRHGLMGRKIDVAA